MVRRCAQIAFGLLCFAISLEAQETRSIGDELRANSDRIASTLPGNWNGVLNPNKNEFLIRFTDGGNNSSRLLLESGASLPLLDNEKSVKKLTTGRVYVATFSSEISKGTLSVESVVLPHSRYWASVSRSIPSQQRGDLDLIVGKANKAILESLDKTHLAALEAAIEPIERKLFEECVDRFLQSTDPMQRQAHAEELSLIRSGRDRYTRRAPPSTYKRIYGNCQSSLVIRRTKSDGTETEIGSGVLIGEGLVLTARHVIEKAEEDAKPAVPELNAVFNYEETFVDSNSFTSFRIEYPMLCIGADTDFAIARLRPSTKDGHIAGRDEFTIAPIQFDHKTETPGAEIYVIGCPDIRGSKRYLTIHDNGRLLWPFQADQRACTVAQMLEQGCNGPCSGWGLTQSGCEQPCIYCCSYRPTQQDPKKLELYVSTQADQAVPGMVADIDTYRGNSGSGVWDRETHRLIGILTEGKNGPLGPHEFEKMKGILPKQREIVVPVSYILREVDRTPTMMNWMTKYKTNYSSGVSQ